MYIDSFYPFCFSRETRLIHEHNAEINGHIYIIVPSPMAWEALRKRKQKGCKSQDTRKYVVKQKWLHKQDGDSGNINGNTNTGRRKSCRVISLDKDLQATDDERVKGSIFQE